MNLNKAVSILGLNTDYTLENVNKIFELLVNEYSSNINNYDVLKRKKTEQKILDINMARDYLIIYLNCKVNNCSDSDCFDFIEYKFNVAKKLLFEMKEIEKIAVSKDKLIRKYKLLIYDLIKDYRENVLNSQKKDDISIICDRCREKYNKYLVMYYEALSLSTGISFNINYVRYMSFNNLRDLFENTINEILHKEIIKYSKYSNYNLLIKNFLIFKSAYAKVCLYGYMNIFEAKREVNNEILNEFKNYLERKKILEELRTYNTLVSPKIIDDLEENICNHFVFNDKCLEIKNDTKIRGKIRRMLKRQIKK